MVHVTSENDWHVLCVKICNVPNQLKPELWRRKDARTDVRDQIVIVWK